MTTFVRASGAGDGFRSPHDGQDDVAEDMTPTGICESCSHQALRHSRLQCRFHELDPAHGPIRRLSDRPAPL